MKVSFVSLLVIFFVFPVLAMAQDEMFMGYVDDGAILEKLPAVKEVQRILDQETEVWDAQFKDDQQGLKTVSDSITALEKKLAEARVALEKGRQEDGKKELPAKPEAADSSLVPADSLATVPDSLSGDSTAAGDSVRAVEKTPPATQVKKAVVITPEDTLNILADISTMEVELERSKKKLLAQYRKIYGENGILARRNTELSQSLLEKIERAVRKEGEIHRTAMIFDSSILLYVDQDNNLTEPVLKSLGMGEENKR